MRDLNRVYRTEPALHAIDFDGRGFRWLVVDDAPHSVFAFARIDEDGRELIVVANFTPAPRHAYRIGTPQGGVYREILNTDSHWYGGSNTGNSIVFAQPEPGREGAGVLTITLPPLSVVYLQRE